MCEAYEALEKSNYHLHLTGAMSTAVIGDIATKLNAPHPAGQLDDYLDFEKPEIWAAAKELTSSRTGLELSINNVVARELMSGTNYVELTVNTFGMVRRGMSEDEIASSLQNSAQYAASIGASLKVKFGVNRKDGPGSVAIVRGTYLACSESVRLGIDLNGDERIYPTVDFVEPFSALSSEGIATTIHAGEFPEMTESLEQALDAEPQRIAHAIATGPSRHLLGRIGTQGVIIESALTSNLRRGVVEDLSKHPLKQMLDEQITVVLGTDDPGFFSNTMTDELRLLEKMGFSENEVKELNATMNSFRKD